MERSICIHGHFYQPPRENPRLEAIELQDSAFPYHDWNERITAECYAPNGAARILDPENRIERIVNNYARITFNFGPTLLAWMQSKTPQVYQSVLAADRESRARFSGLGSAIAQVYNHVILPLVNKRDKRTQVLWGIRDFEARFGRKPEGMWLPETAVDLETLEMLAESGIQFTVLSRHQASRARARGGRAWREVKGGGIDPSTAYLLRLSSGRNISLFFYDGPISRAVAFENLLDRGENLAHRLAGAFSDKRSWPQLVHMATDGETYGHHRAHGDMALAYAPRYLEANPIARLTNYGEFLEMHPPAHEVQIVENSSWSCVHGVERAAQRFLRSPENLQLLQDLDGTMEVCALLPFEVNLWTAQDIYFEVMKSSTAQFRKRAQAGDAKSQLWLMTAASPGERLYVIPNRLAGKALA